MVLRGDPLFVRYGACRLLTLLAQSGTPQSCGAGPSARQPMGREQRKRRGRGSRGGRQKLPGLRRVGLGSEGGRRAGAELGPETPSRPERGERRSRRAAAEVSGAPRQLGASGGRGGAVGGGGSRASLGPALSARGQPLRPRELPVAVGGCRGAAAGDTGRGGVGRRPGRSPARSGWAAGREVLEGLRRRGWETSGGS